MDTAEQLNPETEQHLDYRLSNFMQFVGLTIVDYVTEHGCGQHHDREAELEAQMLWSMRQAFSEFDDVSCKLAHHENTSHWTIKLAAGGETLELSME